MKRPTMHDFVQFFRDIPAGFAGSIREFRRLPNLVGAAMILGVSVVLSFFSIIVSPTLQIGFSYLATALLGMTFGPVMGAVAAGLGDIIKFIIKPTGIFFPGYTLTAMVGGLIYGIFFYKNKVSITRCIFAKVLINLLANLGLNTLWSYILTGKAFWLIIQPRIWKNIGMLPVEIILLYIVLKAVSQLLPRVNRHYMQIPK